MLKAPLTSPEEPRPATARPTMNIDEDTEVPHRSEPIPKTTTKQMNDHFIEKNVYIFPLSGCKADEQKI